MRIALGFLAVALLGAGAPSGEGLPPIQYQVKLLEMDGLKWRESLYSRLVPIARQGNCAVWTASRDVVKPLVERAERVVMNPRVLAHSDAAAHYSQRTTRRVASQLTRHADGPVDHAIAVAYTPDFEEVREGCQFTVSGRKLDQGMLIKLVVDETRIAAIHQVKLTERVGSQDAKEGQSKITPQLDVPEVVEATLEGEWLIPNDGVLVASMGAHTLDDGHGKALVRERLLMIEAGQAPVTTTVNLQQSLGRAFSFTVPAHAATIPMPQPMPVPAMPSRSLPQGRAADGTLVPLPPLPESQVPPSSLPGSSEPCATPQTPHLNKDKVEEKSQDPDESDGAPTPSRSTGVTASQSKTLDPSYTRASLADEARGASKEASQGSSPWKLIKPYMLRIPLSSGSIEIEVKASVSPGARP
jgi:hypothetical protein